MPPRAHLALGLDAARLMLDLRAGRALDATGRARAVDVLARVLPALAGRSIPPRALADPAVLVEAAVALARDAGMSGPELVVAFNDAVERSPR
jgi:hypothetical protein